MMTEQSQQWEYRVQTFGSIWSGIKDEDLQAVMNSWGVDGWQIISVHTMGNSATVRVVARRPLTRTTRREMSWPGQI